jgi:hypothetical protein
MPGVSGVTVARYMRNSCYGRIGARHSLRPLIERAGSFQQTSGEWRREIAKLCL